MEEIEIKGFSGKSGFYGNKDPGLFLVA